MSNLIQLLKSCWNLLRDACGENDYARYYAREAAHGHQPMTPQAFYVWKINRQYSRPSRCC